MEDKNEVWIKISNEFNSTSGNFPRLKRYRSKNSVLSHLRKLFGLFFIVCSLLSTDSKSSSPSDSNISITSGNKFILCSRFYKNNNHSRTYIYSDYVETVLEVLQ